MQIAHHTDNANNINTDGAHRSAYKRRHHVVVLFALSQCCTIKITILVAGNRLKGYTICELASVPTCISACGM
jgi:hypothetical protein